VGAATLLGSAVVTGVPIAIPSIEAGVYVALAALVPQLVGHTLLTWSLRHTRPTVVGIATVGEPVGSTLLGFVWLHERVDPMVLVGCAVTLAAVVTAMWRREKH
jgi:drug/metabolite transporter (DMT)-like permease